MSKQPSSPLSPELIDACRTRQDRLRESLATHAVDAAIINCEKDIRYLTGFVGHDSLVLAPADGPTAIISDPRYDEFLNPWREIATNRGDDGLGEVHMGTRHRLHETIKTISDKRGYKRVALQADHLTINDRQAFEQSLGNDRLVDRAKLVATLRMCKDELEVQIIEKALHIQQQALHAALSQLSLGMTERECCALLEYEMKTRGGDKPSFDIIIGAGSNSSIIHHMPGDRRIDRGVLLVDWGCEVDGYCGDITRTFGVGELPAKIKEIYTIVHKAQLQAIEACRPGKTCAEIDAVAREAISRAGYGEYFGHGLGHGLGMDVHEMPYFNNLQTDIVLQPGMVMTVEPGIYLPGEGGVRIEDDVLITDDGVRVLSSWPKGLDEAIVEPAGAATV